MNDTNKMTQKEYTSVKVISRKLKKHTHTKYKMKSSTYALSHANRNKLKK